MSAVVPTRSTSSTTRIGYSFVDFRRPLIDVRLADRTPRTPVRDPLIDRLPAVARRACWVSAFLRPEVSLRRVS